MVGLAVSVAALATVYALQGSQQRQLTTHSTTAAQGAAWRGVEVVRGLVEALTVDEFYGPMTQDAGGGVRVEIPGTGGESRLCWEYGGHAAGGLSGQALARIGVERAAIVRVCEPETTGGTYQVTAHVTGFSGEADPDGARVRTTSTVEAVYEVQPATTTAAPGGGGGGGGTLGVVELRRDLDMTGGIKVLGGQNANFNVQGNVNLDNASIDGINTLRATGNVRIGSGIKVNTVYANGDVTLTGSASVSQIFARGNVRIEGGANPLSIRSNGVVTFAGGSGAVVEAVGGIVVTGGGVTITTAITEGDITWSGTGGGASNLRAGGNVNYAGGQRAAIVAGGTVTVGGGGASTVQAGGPVRHQSYGTIDSIVTSADVFLTGSGSATQVRSGGHTYLQGSGSIGTINGRGSLTVSAWQSVGGGTIGGPLYKTEQWNGNVRVTVQPGYTVDIPAVARPVVERVGEIALSPLVVDVYPLRAAANYVFEWIDTRIRVTVANVSGIPDGQYVLGNRVANYNTYPDWLCRPEHMSGQTCTRPVATICQGFSPQNGCFSRSGTTWTVNGTSMARGIAWFDGDLSLGNGTYVATFLAAGNISTAGGHRTLSPNYAGYAAVCTNATPAGTSLGVNPDFATLVPLNLCDLEARSLRANALGNTGYIAGGTAPGTRDYIGGDISIGASSRVDGAVTAGNVLTTGGSTTISGRVVSAGQRRGDTTPARFGGSTTIDLTGGAAGYDPDADPPCMGSDCGGGDTTETPAVATLRWSRYL
ncbi:hypothetical protein [Luteimonas sp. FCS-9]|uniref:hypothetical protein n=1 Tax=Luteimonas sp. FCS-9 TaxID=1547516 RepID=UPI00063EBCC6|nr:hypothetical protein [Luteimonas sp. FCS-9]KLI99893.1 hypothetical protein WQ56_10880 [Luteimonas sp. FCS-9]